jgi:sulfur-oxidizing protein SoxB
LQRRDFLQALILGAAAGASLRPGLSEAQEASELYDVPPFGNVSLLHITDVHAQLLPVYFREPGVNLATGKNAGQPPHLVGEQLLKRFGIPRGSRAAYVFSHLDFERLAERYGKLGGYAHLATLVKRLRAGRPHALLLDGGDSWQGSATALWTRGADMIGAQRRLGVDLMTAHWEFTYGTERVQHALREIAPIEFLAQNVRTVDFEEPVFKAYSLRTPNGVPVAVIGQAFPYTPIANPRHLIPEWTFGIQEGRLQKIVDQARAEGAKAVVLLSHNGVDVDLKLASRVRGIDAILGGHTHDALPAPTRVGKTLVTNAGSNGKFVAVLDLQVGSGGVTDYRYRLLPVFAALLPPEAEMAKYISAVRQPYEEKLAEKLAVTQGLLYRRGNFNGSFDELFLEALAAEKNAEISFSPGFRFGAALLPGEPITLEDLMGHAAITYPQTTVNELTGSQIKAILEDVADNVFHPDPYLQQGGDMVRVGGMTYAIEPGASIGARISDMRIGGGPMQAEKRYKVAGWAPVAEGASGEPVWEVVSRYLRGKKTITPRPVHQPRLLGVKDNPGIS